MGWIIERGFRRCLFGSALSALVDGNMRIDYRKIMSPGMSIIIILAIAALACGFPAMTAPAAATAVVTQASSSTKANPETSATVTSTVSQTTPTPILLTPPAPAKAGYRYARHTDPDRTVVTDGSGRWLATFTDNAYTVTLAGPERTFSDPNSTQPVVTNVWVRVLPTPFASSVDEGWLARALSDASPDIFAVAMQYVHGAPAVADGHGLQIAGEAKYGPVAADDTREEGGDFNDYLGIPWTFGPQARQPRTDFFRSLDCSGFMRMVWGYRAGLPLTYVPDNGHSIPRHSWEILASAPGVVIIPDTEAQVTDLSRLVPGDLVFFHAKTEDHDPQIDHVGMYLGKDTEGHYRFISSRQTVDGPTLGDVAGSSLLDGEGLYARSFRAARRL